jgi:hypothetical protein
MSAPKDNKNAEGNKGGNGAPSVIDRELSKKVRNLALEEIYKVLSLPVVKMQPDDYELYKAILIKLAGTVLPRLNELTGADGGAIQIAGNSIKIEKYGDSSKTNSQ